MRHSYNLLHGPTGETYRRLVTFAAQNCERFLLVQRTDAPRMGQEGRRFLETLRPYLIEVAERSEWPGTKLMGHVARIHMFRATPDAASALAGATDRLYGWLHPDLPEDLCALRADGTPLLATIAHERDGFLVLSPEEKRALLHEVPDLALGPAAPI